MSLNFTRYFDSWDWSLVALWLVIAGAIGMLAYSITVPTAADKRRQKDCEEVTAITEEFKNLDETPLVSMSMKVYGLQRSLCEDFR